VHGYAQIVVGNPCLWALMLSKFLCFGATLVCLVNDEYGGL
jgi:hypothetical protein